MASAQAAKIPYLLIQPRTGFFRLDLKQLWQYREMLWFLVWRDVLLRYKQTAVGAAWVILQPTVNMVIFTLIFSRVARIPSDGIPYPVFAFSALLPWSYFAQALTRSSGSVVMSSNLITKIYFPRLLIPVAAAISPAVDLLCSFAVLLALLAWFRIPLSWAVLALPLFIGLAVLSALAIALWCSALNVRYRDVANVMPFLIQAWMYASPVVYPVSMVPQKWRVLYALNPMVGVIEGFRWALLGTHTPQIALIGMSTGIVAILLTGGIVFFQRMESTFADVI